MFYAQALHASLLAISFLPLLNAQYLRAEPPLPTAPPLFIRQFKTCGSTATLCTDGSGGCCDIGAACTHSGGLPICDELCGFGDPQCTGIMDGACCKIGYTCNYVSTVCVKNSLGFPVVPTFTPVIIPTISVAPIFTPVVIPTAPVTLTYSLPLVPNSTSKLILPSSTTPSETPSSTTSAEEQTTSKEVTSSTEAELTLTSSSGLEETPSTSAAAAPTQSVISNAQDKLGFDLKLLLAGYGLAFLYLGMLGWIM